MAPPGTPALSKQPWAAVSGRLLRALPQPARLRDSLQQGLSQPQAGQCSLRMHAIWTTCQNEAQGSWSRWPLPHPHPHPALQAGGRSLL